MWTKEKIQELNEAIAKIEKILERIKVQSKNNYGKY